MYQLALTLYIYRVGGLYPLGVETLRNTTPNSDWSLDWSDRPEPVWGAGLPGDITSSSGVQIGCSIYAFQSSQRGLRNGEVQLTI